MAAALLPDAEFAEDAAEQVVRGDLAGDLAQVILCLPPSSLERSNQYIARIKPVHAKLLI